MIQQRGPDEPVNASNLPINQSIGSCIFVPGFHGVANPNYDRGVPFVNLVIIDQARTRTIKQRT
jgi:hypothetical protein